ncbi:MAG: hypothetical protein HC860_05935 [Alkalinema sp. RU_4_3]|nr:hypothetical protein [Alkalinema sp. RU_4_3]
MIESFWEKVNTVELRQGDYLPGCLVPVSDFYSPDREGDLIEERQTLRVDIGVSDLIVITQSCDLENKKASLVAFCRIFTISKFEEVNTTFSGKKWNEVRKGKVEGLHLLGSFSDPADSRSALVVDFRQIHSLPIAYVTHHAQSLGDRWRLRSPYLEHFSQGFARFFMRVGLPSSIPEFK